MIIILEGPDGGGKTTLARELCSRYHLEYRHEGPPPTDVTPLMHYGSQLQRARETDDVLFDRFALGETIYGPILRGEDKLGDEGWRLIRRLIWAAGAHQVMCLPPLGVSEENWRHKRTDLIKDPDTFEQVWTAYYDLACLYDDDMTTYDYIRDDVDDLIAELAPLPRLTTEMIGHPSAPYLFVGERGSNVHSSLDLPFFGVINSAHYLNTALDLAGFEEHELAFINAFPLRELTARSLPTSFAHVIALGHEAAKVCRAQDLPCCEVPHPAFWRRFHHYDVHTYAQKLKDCR